MDRKIKKPLTPRDHKKRWRMLRAKEVVDAVNGDYPIAGARSREERVPSLPSASKVTGLVLLIMTHGNYILRDGDETVWVVQGGKVALIDQQAHLLPKQGL
jgi:hypothetical protein